LPIEAYDLWNEGGSQRALHVLKQYTNAVPVNSVNSEDSCPIILKKF
jgi:hypothetical protein